MRSLLFLLVVLCLCWSVMAISSNHDLDDEMDVMALETDADTDVDEYLNSQLDVASPPTTVNLSASGEYRVEIAADWVDIHVIQTDTGYWKTDGTFQAVGDVTKPLFSRLSQAWKVITTALGKDHQVSEIRESLPQLQELYASDGHSTGYRLTYSLIFRVNVKYAGGIVNQLLGDGSSQVKTAAYGCTNENLQKARVEAIQGAIKDAQAQIALQIPYISAKMKEVDAHVLDIHTEMVTHNLGTSTISDHTHKGASVTVAARARVRSQVDITDINIPIRILN